MSAPVSLLLDYEFEQRVLDVARKTLLDIRECSRAKTSVKFMNGVPILVLEFEHPDLRAKPACGVRLTPVSRQDPAAIGSPMVGERLHRHVRQSVEHYLSKHGIRVPATFHLGDN